MGYHRAQYLWVGRVNVTFSRVIYGYTYLAFWMICIINTCRRSLSCKKYFVYEKANILYLDEFKQEDKGNYN